MGGSGKSFVHDIVEQDIDFYVTGELGYHEIQYLRQQKKGLFYLVIINLRCLFLILFMTSSIHLILRLILLNNLLLNEFSHLIELILGICATDFPSALSVHKPETPSSLFEKNSMTSVR